MDIVNGYYCRTCADVDLAKRFIDPARPKDGPFGKDAPEAKAREAAHQAALIGAPVAPGGAALRPRDRSPPPPGQGLRLDISA